MSKINPRKKNKKKEEKLAAIQTPTDTQHSAKYPKFKGYPKHNKYLKLGEYLKLNVYYHYVYPKRIPQKAKHVGYPKHGRYPKVIRYLKVSGF